MGSIDLHNKPFNEETITKLEIFEDYAQAWLPTFIMQKRPLICIFDFFAGTGYDKKGVAGSPIRILQKINEQRGYLFQYGIKVKLHFNEFEPTKKNQAKFDLLKKSCSEFIIAHPGLENVLEMNYHNQDCETLFPALLSMIKQYPSLVYLDQNGVKFAHEKYFLALEQSRETDFLFFISSSYILRFGNEEEFKKHIDIDIEEAKRDPYKFIHRNVLTQIKKKLPLGSKLKLYPFSIKKTPNIHGIIFGATHPKAVDKFLGIAWGKNKMNGEANFDIEDDVSKDQLSFFDTKKKKKIEVFQDGVREKIIDGVLSNNKQLYDYALEQGHIGGHAADVLKAMKKNNEINYDCISPLVNYENVYKKPRLLSYTALK